MTQDAETQALARQANKKRQMGDAAKLIPFFATALIMVPILWTLGSKTSSALVYIFLVWLLLIVLSALLANALSDRRSEKSSGTSPSETRP